MGVVSCHHALQEVKKLLDNSELSVLQDVLQWRTPRVNTKSMQTSRYIYIFFLLETACCRKKTSCIYANLFAQYYLLDEAWGTLRSVYLEEAVAGLLNVQCHPFPAHVGSG